MEVKPLVYLAGPISGCTFSGCRDWRVGVLRTLLPDIECLSPMRDKEDLEEESVLGEGYTNFLCTEAAITARDAFDIRRSDLLLVNLLGVTEPSQGTLWEMGYAKGLNKTCIIAMEPSGNP